MRSQNSSASTLQPARPSPRSRAFRVVLLAAAFATLAGAAPRGPAARTEAIISRLGADPASRAATAGAVAQARKAVQRAVSARDAGDREHAAMLDDLALEWAELGRDTLRATQVEAAADKAERELQETETKIVRARALLEETIARRGRAREKLDQLEKPTAPTAPSASAIPAKPQSAPPSSSVSTPKPQTAPSSSAPAPKPEAAPKAAPKPEAAPRAPARTPGGGK